MEIKSMDNSNSSPVSSSSRRTLFFEDISIHCDVNKLRELFHPFGDLAEVVLKHGDDLRLYELPYGYVRFDKADSAAKAKEALDNSMLGDRTLRLSWVNKMKRNNVVMINDIKSAQLHVSFVARQSDVTVTRKSLMDMFSHYGDVLDVVLKKTEVNKNAVNEDIQSGYGFVHFANTADGVRSACNAQRTLEKVTVDKVIFDCSLTHTLRKVVETMEECTRMKGGKAGPATGQLQRSVSSESMSGPVSPLHHQNRSQPSTTSLPSQPQYSVPHPQNQQGLYANQQYITRPPQLQLPKPGFREAQSGFNGLSLQINIMEPPDSLYRGPISPSGSVQQQQYARGRTSSADSNLDSPVQSPTGMHSPPMFFSPGSAGGSPFSGARNYVPPVPPSPQHNFRYIAIHNQHNLQQQQLQMQQQMVQQPMPQVPMPQQHQHMQVSMQQQQQQHPAFSAVTPPMVYVSSAQPLGNMGDSPPLQQQQQQQQILLQQQMDSPNQQIRTYIPPYVHGDAQQHHQQQAALSCLSSPQQQLSVPMSPMLTMQGSPMHLSSPMMVSPHMVSPHMSSPLMMQQQLQQAQMMYQMSPQLGVHTQQVRNTQMQQQQQQQFHPSGYAHLLSGRGQSGRGAAAMYGHSNPHSGMSGNNDSNSSNGPRHFKSNARSANFSLRNLVQRTATPTSDLPPAHDQQQRETPQLAAFADKSQDSRGGGTNGSSSGQRTDQSDRVDGATCASVSSEEH